MFHSELFYHFTPNFLTVSLRTFLKLNISCTEEPAAREGRRLCFSNLDER